MWTLISFLVYVLALFALAIISQGSGSWLREADAERMVFRPPWTFRLYWKMFLFTLVGGAVWFVSRGFYLVSLHPSRASYLTLAFSAYVGLGGPAALLFVMRLVDYRSLVIDLSRCSYCYERGWPFGGDGGSLDELARIYNSNGHLLLVPKKKPRFGRGYLLGLYQSSLSRGASETAERLNEMLGLGPATYSQ